MSATNLVDEAQETAQVDPNRWRALVIILIAPFLSVLDFFIVNISIPSIQSGLHATFAEVQLVIAGYGLTYAVFLVTGGRLGDIYGRKRMFMLGMGGFTLASALCGFAHSPNMLIGSRLLQGLMAALMVPQTLAIVQVSFPQKERSLAFGSFGATLGLASIAGQLLGGLLINANLFGLTWRPVFLVNLPVGIIALFLAWPILKESRSPKCLRLDPGGVLIVSVALFLLVYPLVEGREAGWPVWTYFSVAGSFVMLGVFVFYERWKERRDHSPLVALSLFSNRAFVTGLGIIVLFFVGLPAFFLTLTVFLQTGLNFTPLAAGLAFAPFAVGFFAASTASVKLQPKLKSRILNLGAVLMMTGLLWLIHIVRVDGAALHGSNLILVLLVYGMGQGFITAPLFNIILSGIGSEDAGSASGVLSTMQQIASAIGVALIGSIFFGLLGGVDGGNNTGAQNYIGAFTTTLFYNVGLLAATFLLALFLPRGCTGHLDKDSVTRGAVSVHA